MHVHTMPALSVGGKGFLGVKVIPQHNFLSTLQVIRDFEAGTVQTYILTDSE